MSAPDSGPAHVRATTAYDGPAAAGTAASTDESSSTNAASSLDPTTAADSSSDVIPDRSASTVRRPATDAERRALASVVRLRVLRMCLYEPLTNRQLADRLKMNPATMLHHVRTLADLGFLEAGEVQRGRRGAREIPYRATGKSWALDMGDPADFPTGSRLPLVQAFLAEVAEAPVSEVSTSRLGLQLSAAHEEELRARLAALLEEFAERPHDPGGRRWSVFLALHPES